MRHLFLTCALLLSSIVYAQKPTFIVYTIFNTGNSLIGRSLNVDRLGVTNLCKGISSILGYQLQVHDISGENYRYENVMASINSQKINELDIVMIYISGDGGSLGNAKRTFPIVDINGSPLVVSDLHDIVGMKKPKCLITVVSSPNSSRNSTFRYEDLSTQDIFLTESNSLVSQGKELENAPLNKNVKNLFSTNFSLLISSTTFAQGAPIATLRGTVFTEKFLKKFKEAIYSKNAAEVSWEAILLNTKREIFALSTRYSNLYYPVWQFSGPPKMHSPNGSTVRKTMLITKTARHSGLLRKRFSEIELNVKSDSEIDSVTYYLHHTMPKPVVTVKKSTKDFMLTFSVWGEFPIRATVYYPDGSSDVLYSSIKL